MLRTIIWCPVLHILKWYLATSLEYVTLVLLIESIAYLYQLHEHSFLTGFIGVLHIFPQTKSEELPVDPLGLLRPGTTSVCTCSAFSWWSHEAAVLGGDSLPLWCSSFPGSNVDCEEGSSFMSSLKGYQERGRGSPGDGLMARESCELPMGGKAWAQPVEPSLQAF
jgi:hypothetical protein